MTLTVQLQERLPAARARPSRSPNSDSQVIAKAVRSLSRASPEPASLQRRDWIQGPLFWLSHIAALVLASILLGLFLAFAIVLGGAE